MISYFGPNISCLNSRKKFHILIPNLHYERLHSIIFPINKELGKDKSMSAENAEITRPEFSGANWWCLYDKLIFVNIESSNSLQRRNVGSMPHLSLSIATHYLKSFTLW